MSNMIYNSNMIYKKIRTSVYLPFVIFFILPLFVAVYATIIFLFPLLTLMWLLINRNFEGFKYDMREAYIDMPLDFIKDIFSECF